MYFDALPAQPELLLYRQRTASSSAEIVSFIFPRTRDLLDEFHLASWSQLLASQRGGSFICRLGRFYFLTGLAFARQRNENVTLYFSCYSLVNIYVTKRKSICMVRGGDAENRSSGVLAEEGVPEGFESKAGKRICNLERIHLSSSTPPETLKNGWCVPV